MGAKTGQRSIGCEKGTLLVFSITSPGGSLECSWRVYVWPFAAGGCLPPSDRQSRFTGEASPGIYLSKSFNWTLDILPQASSDARNCLSPSSPAAGHNASCGCGSPFWTTDNSLQRPSRQPPSGTTLND